MRICGSSSMIKILPMIRFLSCLGRRPATPSRLGSARHSTRQRLDQAGE
jgi:hypothetical protein